MYAIMPEAEVGVYADHWQKGRYRVELTVELPLDPSDVETALEKIGYQEIDSDQWGQSYRHHQESQKTAELDDILYSETDIKLMLQYGGLEESELDQTKYNLQLEFEQIFDILRDNQDTWEDRPEHYYHLEQETLVSRPDRRTGQSGIDR